MQETLFDSWVWKIWRRDRLPTAVFLVFPCDSAGKESAGNVGDLAPFPGGSEVKVSAWNAGDPGSIPGSGGSPGEGNGNPLQYSSLENPMEGGAW